MKAIRQYSILILLMGLATAYTFGQSLPKVCVGGKVRYGVQGLPGSHFNWSISGATVLQNYGDSIDVQWNVTPGVYSMAVQEISAYNCAGPLDTASVLVDYNTISLGSGLAVCTGDSLVLTAPSGYTSYLWSDGSTGQQKVTHGGSVWLLATDASGCKARDSVFVKINNSPVVDIGKDTSLCGDETITLDAGPGGTDYLWTIRQGTSVTQETGQYLTVTPGVQIISVVVTDYNGCTGRDTMEVSQCRSNPLGVIPNAFTPNNDGKNDRWHIESMIYYPDASVEIYDRWGRLVFKRNKNYSDGEWDGTSGGKRLPMDSYFYVIDLHTKGISTITGFVTIIR